MWGELIGAGLKAITGRRDNANLSNMQDQQLLQQQIMAKQGLQWRVEDAKQAGVHPLYALGAQLPAFNPVAVQYEPQAQNMGDLGTAIGNVIDRLATREKQKGKVYPVVEAGVYNVPGVLKQSENPQDWSPLDDVPGTAEQKLQALTIEGQQLENDFLRWRNQKEMTNTVIPGFSMVPNQITQSGVNAYLGAGPGKPAWDLYHAGPGGFKMLAPQANNFGEAMESIEHLALQVMTIGINVAHFGPGWITEARKFIPRLFQGISDQSGAIPSF